MNKKSRTPVDFEKVLSQLYTESSSKQASLQVSQNLPGRPPYNLGGNSSIFDGASSFLAPSTMPSTPMQNRSNPIGDQTRALNELSVDPSAGSSTMTSAPRPVIPGTVKQAMTEDQLLAYYSSPQDILGAGDSSGPLGTKLTPKNALMLGAAGTAGLATSRLRGDLSAKRQLRSVRKQLMEAMEQGTVNRNLIKNLNRELNIRGAAKTLSKVPTIGLADAQLVKAEKSLAKKLRSRNTRALLPVLATTLLGTAVYNKLTSDD